MNIGRCLLLVATCATLVSCSKPKLIYVGGPRSASYYVSRPITVSRLPMTFIESPLVVTGMVNEIAGRLRTPSLDYTVWEVYVQTVFRDVSPEYEGHPQPEQVVPITGAPPTADVATVYVLDPTKVLDDQARIRLNAQVEFVHGRSYLFFLQRVSNTPLPLYQLSDPQIGAVPLENGRIAAFGTSDTAPEHGWGAAPITRFAQAVAALTPQQVMITVREQMQLPRSASTVTVVDSILRKYRIDQGTYRMQIVRCPIAIEQWFTPTLGIPSRTKPCAPSRSRPL